MNQKPKNPLQIIRTTVKVGSSTMITTAITCTCPTTTNTVNC